MVSVSYTHLDVYKRQSTLLSLLAGLKLPTEGEITPDEQPIRLMDRSALRRDTVSVIYQDFNLFPLLTAEENVCYPCLLYTSSQSAGTMAGQT